MATNCNPLAWCSHKCMIPEATTPDNFLLAHDISERGAKEFFRFDKPTEAVNFLNTQDGEALHEVLEHAENNCKLYFDLDRPDTRYSSETMAMHMLTALGSYLSEIFKFDFVPIPGENCQLAQASTDVKTSIHLCCNVRVPSVIAHRALTGSLIKFVLESSGKYPSLVIQREVPLAPGVAVPNACVIDINVYSQFRSFRMLGMVKFGRQNPLVPLLGSSSSLVDHLIGIYPSLHEHTHELPGLPKPTNSEGPLLQMCGTHIRKPIPFSSNQLPPSTHQEFEKLLNGWKSVQEQFKGTPLRIYSVAETESHYRLRVDKCVGLTCLYAKRHHKSNNTYIVLAKDKRSAEFVCYDVECLDVVEHNGRIQLFDNDWGASTLYDSIATKAGGLHAQRNNIDWYEDYDEPAMRELPEGPMVCVLAGMGIGKTVAIKSTLLQTCKPVTKKALVITHSRSLAAKIFEDFKELGFVNYQEVTGPINDCKIVVCLDSLYRVTTKNFDTVVIDEAVAVFLHFNSTQMVKRAENSSLLELIVMQARSTYFMDAALDATFMKNIVDYFCKMKTVTPQWVRNSHVRATNRNAEITICDGAMGSIIGEGSLVYAAAVKVLDLLLSGKRVVCCSSTRKFTEILETFIAESKPDALIKVYNAATAAGTDLRHVETEWIKYDLLIYSPSISSGVSFVAKHFDCLVAYFVNSVWTPSVETGLQQLFRVRQLSDGDMHLYIHNARPGVELPCSVGEIEPLLSQEIALVAKHFVCNQLSFFSQVRISGDRVEYDRDRLSWKVILGIIQTQNLSAMYYTDIFTTALRSDYGIPVQITKYKPSGSMRDVDMAVLQNATKTRTIPAFDTIKRLAPSEYEGLKNTTDEVTLEDRAAMKLYDCEHAIWGVKANLVDETFYKSLVMSAGAFEYYFHVKRFLSLKQHPEENRNRMRAKINEIMHMSDKNLELYKSKSKTHYSLLISGQALLHRILDSQERHELLHFRHVLVPITRLSERLSDFRAGLSPTEHNAFKSLFKVKEMDDLEVVKAVMKSAFDIKVKRQYRQPEKKGFHIAEFDNDKLHNYMTKFEPTFPTMG